MLRKITGFCFFRTILYVFPHILKEIVILINIMPYINGLNDFLKRVKEARYASPPDSEPPENCGHGKHEHYYQGVLQYKSQSSGKTEKYKVVGYNNSITENQVMKILTMVNSNSERDNSKSTASTRGSGIDDFFLHYGDKVTILTEKSEGTYICCVEDLKYQIELINNFSQI